MRRGLVEMYLFPCVAGGGVPAVQWVRQDLGHVRSSGNVKPLDPYAAPSKHSHGYHTNHVQTSDHRLRRSTAPTLHVTEKGMCRLVMKLASVGGSLIRLMPCCFTSQTPPIAWVCPGCPSIMRHGQNAELLCAQTQRALVIHPSIPSPGPLLPL